MDTNIKNTLTHDDKSLKILVFVTSKREVCFFHDKPFSKTLSWLEYNAEKNMIEFVMEDGDIRNFGIPLPEKYRSDVVSSKIAYVIHKNPETKQVISGRDLPLVVQGLPYY